MPTDVKSKFRNNSQSILGESKKLSQWKCYLSQDHRDEYMLPVKGRGENQLERKKKKCKYAISFIHVQMLTAYLMLSLQHAYEPGRDLAWSEGRTSEAERCEIPLEL